jgi:hypothetical protein
MEVQGRIAPAQPPFRPEIQSALDLIMPEGVAPLVLFTTLAETPASSSASWRAASSIRDRSACASARS